MSDRSSKYFGGGEKKRFFLDTPGAVVMNQGFAQAQTEGCCHFGRFATQAAAAVVDVGPRATKSSHQNSLCL